MAWDKVPIFGAFQMNAEGLAMSGPFSWLPFRYLAVA